MTLMSEKLNGRPLKPFCSLSETPLMLVVRTLPSHEIFWCRPHQESTHGNSMQQPDKYRKTNSTCLNLSRRKSKEIYIFSIARSKRVHDLVKTSI